MLLLFNYRPGPVNANLEAEDIQDLKVADKDEIELPFLLCWLTLCLIGSRVMTLHYATPTSLVERELSPSVVY